MPLRQSLVRKRSRAKSRRQLQLSTGGVVSTTVTVWLHLALLPQSSTACQVWVMTHGQEPFVTVLMTVTVTPPFGVPGWGQHALVHVGGSNVQLVRHSTVFLGAQFNANGPVTGESTVKFTEQESLLPAQSRTVTVIG